MEALKPCPFCGNDGSGPIEDALQICHNEPDFVHGTRHTWSVQCDKCTATMGYSDSEEEAIAAWNRRADPRPAAQLGVVKEAVRRELADVEASLDDAISYLVDLAGAKPTPMSPQNCRIHIDHARMSARNLAALAAPVSQEPVAWTDEQIARFGEALCAEDPGDPLKASGPKLESLAKHVLNYVFRDASPHPLTEGEPSEAEVERAFTLGQRVTKARGSSWTGHVVGFYSTDLTPIGYAVESENERGSVQIYPEAALLAAKSKGWQADG